MNCEFPLNFKMFNALWTLERILSLVKKDIGIGLPISIVFAVTVTRRALQLTIEICTLNKLQVLPSKSKYKQSVLML